MGTIFDYLEWRADIPFSVDPFNEVDNLVLAQLSYTDFGGIVPDDSRSILLTDACRIFFSQHTREEILANKSITARAPLLMEEMAKGQRYGRMRLRRYVRQSGENHQFAAITFGLEDGTEYVAFRGTDGTVTGWKEDFNFCFMDETEGQRLATEYLNSIRGRLRVGGHSKGGYLAVYASAFCKVQKRIFEVYSNDGPGFRETIAQREEFQRIQPIVKKIIPDSSVIGLLFADKEDCLTVKSSAIGIRQHDAFTWQVKRNRFENAPLSETSRLIARTIGNWLGSMSEQERQSFTELVFSLIESTGQERFSSMSENKLKTMESIMNAIRQLPREKQMEGMKLIATLSQSSGQTLWGYMSGLLKLPQL